MPDAVAGVSIGRVEETNLKPSSELFDAKSPTPYILDVGMHNGDDTNFYLKKGYRVVAVEANPELVEAGERRFSAAIAEGRLHILQGAITSTNQPTVAFYIHPERSEWSSIAEDVASRDGTATTRVEAPAMSLDQILGRFGEPYYVKIDIEQADRIALRQLGLSPRRPRYVSVEGHEVAFLTYLRDMGYTHFKLVNQDAFWSWSLPNPALEGVYVDHEFTMHSSGPFGEEAAGRWVDYEEAALIYLQLKIAERDNPGLLHHWFDFHAKHVSASPGFPIR